MDRGAWRLQPTGSPEGWTRLGDSVTATDSYSVYKENGKLMWREFVFRTEMSKKKSNLFDTAICSQLLHFIYYNNLTGFAGGSVVKNLPAMQDLQGKWQPTPVFILARRIPKTEKPGRQ